MHDHAEYLPQLAGGLFLTDSGLETDLIFNEGLELPEFAAFVLLEDDTGRDALRDYYWRHVEIARRSGTGFIFESPTWRSNPDWAEKLGYSPERTREINVEAIDLLAELRDRAAGDGVAPIVISGCVGPRGDGYSPETIQSSDAARAYHAPQVNAFAEAGADMVTAITMTHAGEAIGIALAARDAGVPSAISFTVETDGRLPDGTPLRDAIRSVDAMTNEAPAYFMINCAHPDHFDGSLEVGSDWTARIRGLRANASRKSHAELDEATELDDGDPRELGEQYARLRTAFPQINVLGGCCGTDARHIQQIALACKVD